MDGCVVVWILEFSNSATPNKHLMLFIVDSTYSLCFHFFSSLNLLDMCLSFIGRGFNRKLVNDHFLGGC